MRSWLLSIVATTHCPPRIRRSQNGHSHRGLRIPSSLSLCAGGPYPANCFFVAFLTLPVGRHSCGGKSTRPTYSVAYPPPTSARNRERSCQLLRTLSPPDSKEFGRAFLLHFPWAASGQRRAVRINLATTHSGQP